MQWWYYHISKVLTSQGTTDAICSYAHDMLTW